MTSYDCTATRRGSQQRATFAFTVRAERDVRATGWLTVSHGPGERAKAFGPGMRFELNQPTGTQTESRDGTLSRPLYQARILVQGFLTALLKSTKQITTAGQTLHRAIKSQSKLIQAHVP